MPGYGVTPATNIIETLELIVYLLNVLLTMS